MEQYPPGVAANGTLTNVSTLLDAHFDATANQSMALTAKWRGANESVVRRYVHGADRTPYYSTLNRTTDEGRTVQQFYGTHSHGYARTVLPDETRYSVTQNTAANVDASTLGDPSGGPRSTLSRVLRTGNYSVNGTVERNGRTFVQLTADEPSSNPQILGITAYEGTALVTPDGVVYDVDTSLVQTTDDTTEHYEESVTLDTSVNWSGPPAWMADVPHLSLSIVEDGHALEIRNTGGAALPANVSFHVSAANEPVWGPTPGVSAGDVAGTVTTDARLDPGDAVYVTAGADGNSSSFALHDEPTRGDYTIGFAGVRSEAEHVTYRLVTGVKTAQND